MSLSTDRTSPPADTQMITQHSLQGIVREHITFENSQIGDVETVNEDDEVLTENLSENRVSSNAVLLGLMFVIRVPVVPNHVVCFCFVPIVPTNLLQHHKAARLE